MENKKEQESRLGKKEINQAFHRWYWSVEVPSSYERMQGLSFCYSMIPVLQKLYTDQKELNEAYRRHLTFFNTQGTWGTPIHGITIAMEEEMSAKGVAESQSDAAITSIKTGLMGPLAGIGDTIDWGTLKTIIYGIGVTFAMTGSALGAVIPFAFTLLTYFVAKYLWNLGYTIGRESVQSILQSGWIDKLISSTAVLGLFMMGSLSATYVKLEIPITFSVGGSEFSIQAIIDSLAPGLLPLGVVFAIYYVLVNKSQKYGLISITIVGACLLGSLIGLF